MTTKRTPYTSEMQQGGTMTDKPNPNFFTVAVSNQRVDLDKKYANAAGKYRRFLSQLMQDVGILMSAPPATRSKQTIILARIAATAEAWHDHEYEIKEEPVAGYTLTGETLTHTGVVLHRIQYRDGTRGGWIESHSNLQGNARVLENAMVWGEAVVCGDAVVTDKAHVRGQARVEGNAAVRGEAKVGESARITDQAIISGEARVGGEAIVCEYARVRGNAWVHGNAIVGDKALIAANANINGGRHGSWGEGK